MAEFTRRYGLEQGLDWRGHLKLAATATGWVG
jgi:hypothetical protein